MQARAENDAVYDMSESAHAVQVLLEHRRREERKKYDVQMWINYISIWSCYGKLWRYDFLTLTSDIFLIS